MATDSSTDGFTPKLTRFPQNLVNRFNALSTSTRAMIWAAAAGLSFSILNTLARSMSIAMHPFQAQFLRYLFGLMVMLPIVLHAGWRMYVPTSVRGQFWRGTVHTIGLALWFTALPHLAMADTTAIGFTGPIFLMLGAALWFQEKMRWERWVAAGVGLAGVLIVVGPKMTGAGGWWALLMLASVPVFSVSFLLTKALSRHDSSSVIVLWQAITVSLLSLPLALPHWQAPTLVQLGWFLVAGILGSTGHYCLTRSLQMADVGATQSIKFLELIWAAALGYLVFGDHLSGATMIGGLVIVTVTVWIARRERGWAAEDTEPQ